MTVHEFFDALPSKVDPAKTAGMNNRFAFDIADVGIWTVVVTDGAVSVEEGRAQRRLHDLRERGDADEDLARRGEPDDGLHDRQAQDQGRHGRRSEAAEALLGRSACAAPASRACTSTVRLLVAWGANVLALIVADWVFTGLAIERWGPLLLAGAVFGLANIFLKPLLTFIAIPLIILTFGLAYFFVNVAILAFTVWVVPGLLDRRLLDVRRRGDRDVARQRRRQDGSCGRSRATSRCVLARRLTTARRGSPRPVIVSFVPGEAAPSPLRVP